MLDDMFIIHRLFCAMAVCVLRASLMFFVKFNFYRKFSLIFSIFSNYFLVKFSHKSVQGFQYKICKYDYDMGMMVTVLNKLVSDCSTCIKNL